MARPLQRSGGAPARHPRSGQTLSRRASRERAWIGLLRAVNVGGHHRLPMKELAALLAGLGLREVRTYIQSGKVVFRSGAAAAALKERISAAIATRFRFRPALMLLPAAVVRRAAAANPFPECRTAPERVQVWFLDEAPKATAVARLEPLRAASERLVVRGAVLYLHAPQGVGHSKLAARAERALGVGGTARNWRTVTQLLALAGEAPP